MFNTILKPSAFRPTTSTIARAIRLGTQTRGRASVVNGTPRTTLYENRKSTAPSFERATFTIRVSQAEISSMAEILNYLLRMAQSSTERASAPRATSVEKPSSPLPLLDTPNP